MATVAQLGARALRKLGLTPIALADQPSAGTAVSVLTVAARVLRLLGVSQAGLGAVSAAGSTVTMATIGTRALRRLAVAPAEETPVATDQTMAEEKVLAVHEALAANKVATWASSAIPTYVAEHYTIMTASLLAPAFGLTPVAGDFAEAEARVRQIVLSYSTGQAAAETEVEGVHQTVVALGYATWADTAIPEAVAPHYATMAAARLAPAYGKPGDDAAYASALALIRQFAYSGTKGQAIAEEKVTAAQAYLAARGLARWTIAAIPTYAEEPIVMIAAEMLAPDVGRPIPSGGWTAEAIRMIRQVISVPSAGGAVVIEAY